MPKQPLATFRSTHDLPALERWLSLEEEVAARDVRIAFQDKIVGFGEFLEHVLWPDTYTSGLEASQFDEREHEELLQLYARLAQLEKDCAILDLDSSEDDELAMVRTLAATWPSIVTDMKRVIARTRDAYTALPAGAGPASYLG